MKIVLEKLTKIFPSRNKKSGEEVVAVNNFNFEIPDGKLIGLLGPSGCGKSTTLYMISGLQKPTSGKIFFGEDDVTELSTEKRGIGLVFQNYALYPHMTVLQNILFPLQNLTGADKLSKEQMLDRAREALEGLLATYDRGRYICGGVPCVLAGRPNAGKSSLLNALVGYERAIVTDVPGTTRDTVEERCRLGGVVLRLIDTAGLRETEDTVERLGVERSRCALAAAELALLVLDGSAPLTVEDEQAMEQAAAAPRVICLVNKSDLPLAVDLERLKRRFGRVCVVSAATGEGLDRLAGQVAELFPTGGDQGAGELLTNARQAAAARRALESVERAQTALAAGVTADAVLTDVEQGLSALGELTGASIREDVTARIFERFCVGK